MRSPRESLPPVSLHFALPLVLAALIALALAGCSSDQSAQSGTPGGASLAARIIAPAPGPSSSWFEYGKRRAHLPYPLSIGNRWDYSVDASTSIVTTDGAQQQTDTQYVWEVAITGATSFENRLYYQQDEYVLSAGAPGLSSTYLERQDRTGLFEVDAFAIPLSARPASPTAHRVSALEQRLIASLDGMPATAGHADAWHRAAVALAARVETMVHPSGTGSLAGVPIPPPTGEMAFLRYPLYVGASWIVRDTPRFERRVAARERLGVPAGQYPAWRITGLSEVYGPNDRATFWYGDPGLLRILVHAEVPATDASGNIIGTAFFDSDQVLTTADLRGSSPISTAAEETGDN